MLKPSCDTLFTHAVNDCVFGALDTYISAAWANPRFISSNQGKNAMPCINWLLIINIPIQNWKCKSKSWNGILKRALSWIQTQIWSKEKAEWKNRQRYEVKQSGRVKQTFIKTKPKINCHVHEEVKPSISLYKKPAEIWKSHSLACKLENHIFVISTIVKLCCPESYSLTEKIIFNESHRISWWTLFKG